MEKLGLNSAGYRIGPIEVENALAEHAAVQVCAVTASPDAERGEIVKAFVVLRDSVQPSPELTRAAGSRQVGDRTL